MTGGSDSNAVDEYIARFPEATREALGEVRDLIRGIAPDATETISYAIPTFDLNGVHLVHFAGYAHHIGLYPTPVGLESFADDLREFKTGKGSVQFPLGEPLPMDLIARIVRYRVEQISRKDAD